MKVKRAFWPLLLLAASGLGLPFASSSAPAQTLNPTFQAAEISTLDLGDPSISQGPGGLIELNNTGLVITNVLDSTYWHNNGDGTTAEYTGFPAIVKAVLDGRNNGTWQGIQGITGTNAAQNPSTYCIAFATVDQLGYENTTWGGVAFTASDTTTNGGQGDLLIRETYVGDAMLDGTVDVAHDYMAWLSSYGETPALPGPVGPAAGDFDYYSLTTGNPVDVAHDYMAWLANYGAPPLGGDVPGLDVSPAGVPVPEPASLAMLAAAGILGLMLIRRSKKLALAAIMLLSFAASARADLVYFLRPVTGDPNYEDNDGNNATQGNYTITGNGVTTPFSISINALPATGKTNFISFELYALIYAGNTAPFYDSPMGAGNITVQQTGTNPLNLQPDVDDTNFIGPYQNSGFSSAGVVEGGNIGQLVGNGGADASNQILAIPGAGFVYPSMTSPSTRNLATLGPGYSNSPATNLTLSRGTLGAVKIADIFYEYGSGLAAGASTLQALAYSSTAARVVSAVWYEDSAAWVNTASNAGPVSGGTSYTWYANGSSSNSPTSASNTIQTGLNFDGLGGVSNTDVTVKYAGVGPATWLYPVSGSWNLPGNWTTGTVPSGVGVAAVVDAATSGPLTITLGAPQTVGSLVLGASGMGGYTIQDTGANTLTFNNSGSGASITVNDGNHVIDAPVVLADSLCINGSGSGWTLTFSNSSTITDNGAARGLTMNGSGGTLVLRGSNNYSGGTTLTAGVLQAGNNAALGATTAPLAVNGGTLDVHGYNLNVGGLSGGGTIDNLAGSGSLTVGNGGGSFTFSGILQCTTGQLSLAKVGAGMLTLGGASTYAGPTTVSAGTLQIAPAAVLTSPSVSVAAGAVLAVAGSTNFTGSSIAIAPGGLLDTTRACGGFGLAAGDLLTAGRPGGGGIDINGDLTLAGGTLNVGGTGTAATLTEAGNLTLAGGEVALNIACTGAGSLVSAVNLNLGGPTTVDINMLAGSLANGDYPLIDYSGSLSGNLSTLALQGVAAGAARQAFVLVASSSSAGVLELQVSTASASLIWSGSGNNVWNTSNVNWINSGVADRFYNGDAVTFDDSAATSTVVVGSAVEPQSVLFNNSALSYTLSGGGGVAGSGSLTVRGGGLVTLANNNAYTGGTTIDAGVLQVGNSAALGAASGLLAVNGGTLDVHGYSLNVGALNGDGTIDNLAGSGSLTAGNGDASSTFSGTIQNTAGQLSLTKAGTGTLLLSGAETYAGPTIVSAGELVLAGSGNNSATFAANGGTLQFNGTTLALGTRYVQAGAGGNVQYVNATVNGGFLFGPGTHTFPAGAASVLNATTINPGTVVQQNGADRFIDVSNGGNVTNNGNLTIMGGINEGAGSLSVNGTVNVSAWSNAGVITVNSGGALNNQSSDLTSSGGGQITVNSGGTLNVDGAGQGTALDLRGSLLVNNGTLIGVTNVLYGATVQGDGTFGPINVYEGGTLAVTSSASLAATSLLVSSGSIGGAGQLTQPLTIQSAVLIGPNQGSRLVLSGDLGGDGAIAAVGGGTVVLSGSDSYLAGTTAASGTLIIAAADAIPTDTSLSVGGDGTLIFDPTASAALSGEAPAAATAVQAVPEPGGLVLLAVGAACALVRRMWVNVNKSPALRAVAG